MSNRSAQRDLTLCFGKVKEAPDWDVALPARGLVTMITGVNGVTCSAPLGGGAGRMVT